MHYLASWSRKNLDFYVPWFLEKFLHIEFRVSKSRVRFRASRLETFLEFLCGSSDPYSSAPSAKGGLQKNGESNLSSLGHRFLAGLNFSVSPRDNRDSCGFGQPLGFELWFRVNSNGLYSESLARPDYPEGDLAAVRDQDFPEH